jgi:anti-anti-sigma factor
MKRVLVIDDERPTLGMFELFLEAYGYEVLTAENASEGLMIFEKERPPIVLTDIKMPGMDGLEVLKKIKEIDSGTEVIVITGHGDMDLAVKALSLHATDFINKPINKGALDDALRRAEQRLERNIPGKETKISARLVDDLGIIDIQGDCTQNCMNTLMKKWEEAVNQGTKKVVFNFDNACTIDGRGMEFLMQLFSEQKTESQSIAVAGISENLKSVFSMVGLTKFVSLHDSQEEAIEALSD